MSVSDSDSRWTNGYFISKLEHVLAEYWCAFLKVDHPMLLLLLLQDSDFGAVSLYAGLLDITDEAWTTANLSDDGEWCNKRRCECE